MIRDNRNELEFLVASTTESINSDREKIKRVIDFMSEKNITPGETASYTEMLIPIQTLGILELCIYTTALYTATGDFRLKPEEWFTEAEIAAADRYIKPGDSVLTEMVFENVTQNDEYQWVSSNTSYQKLTKFFSNHAIVYDKSMQREPLRIVRNNEIAEVPDINPAKVQKIANKMKEKKFTGNMITLNIERTGAEQFYFDETKRTLTIQVNQTNHVSVIDGCHRLLGIMKAVEDEPDIKKSMVVNILNYDATEALEFIWQEGQASPLSERQLNRINPDDTAVLIVREIALSGSKKTNAMFNRVADDLAEIRLKSKYVTYETLIKAVRHNFKCGNDMNPREIRKLKMYLIEGLNEIIGYLEGYFDKSKYLRDRYVYIENNIFIGYIALLSGLWNNENKAPIDGWENTIEKALDRVAFDRDNTDWSDIELFSQSINKSVLIKISNYFIDLIGKGDE